MLVHLHMKSEWTVSFEAFKFLSDAQGANYRSIMRDLKPAIFVNSIVGSL